MKISMVNQQRCIQFIYKIRAFKYTQYLLDISQVNGISNEFKNGPYQLNIITVLLFGSHSFLFKNYN
jgi:hypothetical protein